MEFYARKLDNKTFDLFEGNQYHPDFWTRVKAGKHGVYVKQGRSLPHQVVKALAAQIDPNLNAQIIAV